MSGEMLCCLSVCVRLHPVFSNVCDREKKMRPLWLVCLCLWFLPPSECETEMSNPGGF